MKNFLHFTLDQQCDFKRGRHHGYLNVFALLGRMAPDDQIAGFLKAAEQRHDDDARDESESYLYGVIIGAKEAMKAFDMADHVDWCGWPWEYNTACHATLDFMVPRLRELERESRDAIEICEMVDNLIPIPLEVSTQ